MYGVEIISTEETSRSTSPGGGTDYVRTLVTMRVDLTLVGPHDAPIKARHAAENAVEGFVTHTQIERGPYTLYKTLDGYFDVTVDSTCEY